MARKRKIEKTELDEVERSLYSSFSNAVSSVTSLYSLQRQQKLPAYEAGKRHGLQSLYRWIHSGHQQGSVTSEEILCHLKEKLSAGGEKSATTETQHLDQLLPRQREQRSSDRIVESGEVDTSTRGGDSSGPTQFQNDVPTITYACDRSQSSGHETRTCEENYSSMDIELLAETIENSDTEG